MPISKLDSVKTIVQDHPETPKSKNAQHMSNKMHKPTLGALHLPFWVEKDTLTVPTETYPFIADVPIEKCDFQ